MSISPFSTNEITSAYYLAGRPYFGTVIRRLKARYLFFVYYLLSSGRYLILLYFLLNLCHKHEYNESLSIDACKQRLAAQQAL